MKYKLLFDVERSERYGSNVLDQLSYSILKRKSNPNKETVSIALHSSTLENKYRSKFC